MTLTQLQIFAQLADTGGFTRVAQHMGITQSAVSHALKALEKELEATLIDRSCSPHRLTEVGARLLPKARQMTGLYESIRQDVHSLRTLKTGTLRLGSFGPSASMDLLPELIGAYSRRFPGVDVFVDEGTDTEVMQWLDDYRIDLGVTVLPNDRFDTLRLAQDEWVAVLPCDSELASRAVSIENLADTPFILTQAGSAPWVYALFRGGKPFRTLSSGPPRC